MLLGELSKFDSWCGEFRYQIHHAAFFGFVVHECGM